MDLSKAFDCESHDFIIAKSAVYGVDNTGFKLIHSYSKIRNDVSV